ncbi:hypothetical protein [Streptomyces sp. ID01-9D]|uniref:hypothetical protein n=1 Tax=Streptomyces sp. ID01-9D TaxID=3028659 RepID=UPI0029C2F4B3|nr:hypothetical protein [Streptomyces sp. ID01-9D]MDX5574343.1 hypothetical protein [Streptomyces sp. ID01-9D]
MNDIVAGQLIVTAVSPFEPLEFDSLAGQDALRDIVAELAAAAETDVDAEDLEHYRGLLAAPVIDIRTAPSLLAVAA